MLLDLAALKTKWAATGEEKVPKNVIDGIYGTKIFSTDKIIGWVSFGMTCN